MIGLESCVVIKEIGTHLWGVGEWIGPSVCSPGGDRLIILPSENQFWFVGTARLELGSGRRLGSKLVAWGTLGSEHGVNGPIGPEPGAGGTGGSETGAGGMDE